MRPFVYDRVNLSVRRVYVSGKIFSIVFNDSRDIFTRDRIDILLIIVIPEQISRRKIDGRRPDEFYFGGKY